MSPQKFHRNTQQRQVILEELRLSHTHPTAAELYEQVRQRLPKISLGTVYRNLELLSQMGMAQKLEFSGAEAKFDATIHQHDHVRCTQCGRVDDVDKSSVNILARDCTRLSGYEIQGHRLEFIGVCPDCRKDQTHDEEAPHAVRE